MDRSNHTSNPIHYGGVLRRTLNCEPHYTMIAPVTRFSCSMDDCVEEKTFCFSKPIRSSMTYSVISMTHVLVLFDLLPLFAWNRALELKQTSSTSSEISQQARGCLFHVRVL
jgi:hypothetical protein